jgi:hypothetical protein
MPVQLYSSLFVKGRTVRMVHMPQGLDAASMLEQHVSQLKKQRVAAATAVINRRHLPRAKGIEADTGSDAATAAAAGSSK